MRSIFFISGIILFLSIFWSCNTTPSSVAEMNEVELQQTPGSVTAGNTGQLQWVVPGTNFLSGINDKIPFYGCYFWIRVEDSEKGFRHHSRQLLFPESFTNIARNEITRVQYSLLDIKGEPKRFAYCLIPDSRFQRCSSKTVISA